MEGVEEDKVDTVWWLGDFFGLSLFYSVLGLSCINFFRKFVNAVYQPNTVSEQLLVVIC